MERWLTRSGLVLCGVVVVATAVLLAIRLASGPRTVHHEPCRQPGADATCTHDRYTGNVVSRPWMILLGTLSVCAVAVAMSLREHDRSLSSE